PDPTCAGTFLALGSGDASLSRSAMRLTRGPSDYGPERRAFETCHSRFPGDWNGPQRLPPDTRRRLARAHDRLAKMLSNVQSRAIARMSHGAQMCARCRTAAHAPSAKQRPTSARTFRRKGVSAVVAICGISRENTVTPADGPPTARAGPGWP